MLKCIVNDSLCVRHGTRLFWFDIINNDQFKGVFALISASNNPFQRHASTFAYF